MADGVVRVEQRIGTRREVTRVSAHAVEEYLRTHPGSRALDADWREQADKVLKAEAKAAPAEDKK